MFGLHNKNKGGIVNTETKKSLLEKLIQKSILATFFLLIQHVVAIPPPPDAPMPPNYSMQCEVGGNYYSTGLSIKATGDQVYFHVFSPERPLQTNEKMMTNVSFCTSAELPRIRFG